MKRDMINYLLVICLFQVSIFHTDGFSYPSAEIVPHKGKSEGRTTMKKLFLRFYVRPPKKDSMWETQNSMMECEAGGSPPPILHWMKDGKIIRQGENDTSSIGVESSEDADNIVQTLHVGSTASRLYLECVKPRFSGPYACVATNPYQRISAKSQLTVLPAPEPSGTCASALEWKIPRIYMWSKTRFEYVGGDAKLLCRTHGNPKPKVHWLGTSYKNLPQDDSKYKVLYNGDLIIRKLAWSDMGNYVCVATNENGSDRQESFLYPTAVE